MGYITLIICDAILSTKSYERTSSGRLHGWTSRSKSNQTLQRSPRWDCWSLHDPNVFRRVSLAIILQWRIKNGSYRKHYSWNGGSARISIKLHDPSCILINRAMFQQRRGYNALLIGMQLVEDIAVKNLEAYSNLKLILNLVRGEYEVRHEDLVPYHTQPLTWWRS